MERVKDFLWAILGNLLAAELYANLPTIAKTLIRHATDRLPEPQRSRYREEWLAHLDDLPGSICKLRHGLGCYFAAQKVVPIFDGLASRTRRTIRSYLVSARNLVRACRLRTSGMPGSAVAVVLVLVVASQVMLPIAPAPIASGPSRPTALPHSVAARPSAPIDQPPISAEFALSGASLFIDRDMLKASQGFPAYGLSATALNALPSLDALGTNSALINPSFVAPSVNISSLINGDALKPGEFLPPHGLSATAPIALPGLDALGTNLALINANYVAQSVNISSLFSSDMLSANQHVLGSLSSTASLIETTVPDTSIIGGMTNPALTSLSTPTILLSPSDTLNDVSYILKYNITTTSPYLFSGSHVFGYGGISDNILSAIAKPTQSILPECALCGGVKL